VLFHVFFAWGAELHCLQLKALLFEALNDLADKAALDTIRFDHDEGSLLSLVLHVALPVNLFVALDLDSLDRVRIVLKVAGHAYNFAKVSKTLLGVLVVVNSVSISQF